MIGLAPHRDSIRELVLSLAGPIVWAAHFFVMYAAETLVCIGAAPSRGQFLTIAIPGTTAALIGLAVFIAWQLRFGSHARPTAREGDGSWFLRRASAALAALAMLAILWSAVPVLLLPACVAPT
jgi:hypothetical protein